MTNSFLAKNTKLKTPYLAPKEACWILTVFALAIRDHSCANLVNVCNALDWNFRIFDDLEDWFVTCFCVFSGLH